MPGTEVTYESTSRFVHTKQGRIHYHEAGDEGPPVVLLHGSGPGASGWSNFSSNIAALAESFRVYAVDMPGWGKSVTGTAQERDHAAAYVLLLDAWGIDRAAIVGNSMGGMTGIRVAVSHPDRVSHLIPMGAPTPGANILTPAGGLSEGLQVLMAAYQDPSSENMKRLVNVMAYDPAFASDALAQERADNAQANLEHLEVYLEGARLGVMTAGYDDLVSRLPQVQTQTLVVQGRDDRTVHFEHALRLLALIPNSRLLMFNHCGHWAQLEHAEEFNRAVTDFVLNT